MLGHIIEEFSSLLYVIPAIFLAMGVHEYFHGFVAYKLGDITPKKLGYLNLNPFQHFDLIGFLMLIWFKMGWTKMAPIDYRNVGYSKWKSIAIILSGILGNFSLAIVFILLLELKKPAPESYLFNFIGYSIVLNFNLVLFNLLPLPPLDGGKIVGLFFKKYNKYEFISVLLIIIFLFSKYSEFLQVMSNQIFNLFI